MPRFITAHASHADALGALALAAAQIEAQRAALAAPMAATLGWVYLTDALAPQADALLADLQQRWPGVHWVSTRASA